MGKNNKIRAGRHCLAVLLVHLVFLTKERGKVLNDATAIGILKESFAKVCIVTDRLYGAIPVSA